MSAVPSRALYKQDVSSTENTQYSKKPASKRKYTDTAELFSIKQAQAGSHEAFEKLIHRHDRDIFRLAYYMLGSNEEARDVYQETFMKVWNALGRFRFESSFKTWVYRIAINACFDYLRKRQSLSQEIPYETDEEIENRMELPSPRMKDSFFSTHYWSNPEQKLYGKEIGEKIQEAIKNLNEKERFVFELRYKGLRLRQIGEAIGSTEETAKNYLFRATQKLRAYLRDYFPELDESYKRRSSDRLQRRQNLMVKHNEMQQVFLPLENNQDETTHETEDEFALVY